MSGESEERHMGATVSLNEFTIDQTEQEQGQAVITRSVQWVCQ